MLARQGRSQSLLLTSSAGVFYSVPFYHAASLPQTTSPSHPTCLRHNPAANGIAPLGGSNCFCSAPRSLSSSLKHSLDRASAPAMNSYPLPCPSVFYFLHSLLYSVFSGPALFRSVFTLLRPAAALHFARRPPSRGTRHSTLAVGFGCTRMPPFWLAEAKNA